VKIQAKTKGGDVASQRSSVDPWARQLELARRRMVDQRGEELGSVVRPSASLAAGAPGEGAAEAGSVFDLAAVPAHAEVPALGGATGGGGDLARPDGVPASERVAAAPAAPLSAVPAPRVQRAAAAAPTEDEERVETLVVDDDASVVGVGQARKASLLAEIGRAACDEADRALREVGRDTNGCPQVQRWLSYYASRPAAHLERAIRRYAPETRTARDAREYVAPVAQRIGQGAAEWARTGRIPDDVPEELKRAALGGSVLAIAAAIGGVVGGLFSSVGRTIGGLFRKGQDRGGGGAGRAADPRVVQAQLGPGRALDGQARARMEAAFECDFSRVRVHTDVGATKLADQLRARAFTVGRDVAFGPEEYRPGTLAGDALLAHELAHVVQQGGGAVAAAAQEQPARGQAGAEAALEAEADVAAVDALRVLHGDRRAKKPRPRRMLQRLASPLRLQRCGDGRPSDQRAGTSLPTKSEQREVRAALNLPIAPERSAADASVGKGTAPGSEAANAGATEWAGTHHDKEPTAAALLADQKRAETKARLLQGVQARFNELLPGARETQKDATGVDIKRFEGAANAAKGVVRKKFGAWISGDASVGGRASTHDDFQFNAGQNLKSSFDRSAREHAGGFASAEARVHRLARYSTATSPSVAAQLAGTPLFYNIDRGDRGDPTTEAGFFQAEIVAPFVQAHRAELDLITQFLIAVTEPVTGVVFLPTSVPGGADAADESPNHAERVARWDSFTTAVHEFLHLLTHPVFSRVIGPTTNATEGFTELFTAEVLDGLPLEDATDDDSLRKQVEGDNQPRTVKLKRYETVASYAGFRAAAERARAALARRQGAAGAENAIRGAYFQGHVELLGLDPQGPPRAEGPLSEPGLVTVPDSVQSVAALAMASGVAAADLLRTNPGLTDARMQPPQRVSPLRLQVPGAREHVVIAQEGHVETREIIARVNGRKVDELDRANPGRNWATLAAGQRILIPKK
jgi:LysM repeat protein